MRAEMNERFDRLERRQDHTDETLVRVIDALTSIANVQEPHSRVLEQHSRVLEQHSTLLADLPIIKADAAATNESCKIIEGRLVRLEKTAGLLPA